MPHEQHIIPNLPLSEKTTYEREFNETMREEKLTPPVTLKNVNLLNKKYLI